MQSLHPVSRSVDFDQKILDDVCKQKNELQEDVLDDTFCDNPDYKSLFLWTDKHYLCLNMKFAGLTVVVALLFGVLHAYHVATIFEKDSHFSHLSNLEREMYFHSEMGLYYSYYKRLTKTNENYWNVFTKLLHDNKTEYPSEINALQRFNLYPEVVISALYHTVMKIPQTYNWWWMRECWQVVRGPGRETVTSCVGVGEPVYFYLGIVWLCAALTMALVFLYGCHLGDNLAGGFVAVLGFFYNHRECTRVQWTPPLRESFAYPFCLWQMLVVTQFLHDSHLSRSGRSSFTYVWRIMVLTAICLILWQFSQFIVFTQIFIVWFLYAAGITEKKTCSILSTAVGGAICVASVVMFFNGFLLCSPLTCFVVSVLAILFLDKATHFYKEDYPVTLSIMVISVSVMIKLFMGQSDDAHIFNLLSAKLFGYKDFHTLLYVCSPEFDFMPLEYIRNINASMLLPAGLLVLVLMTAHWIQRFSQLYHRDLRVAIKGAVPPDVAYNVCQLACFGLLAVMIMRLKLFLTPHMCLLVSIFLNKRCRPKMPKPVIISLFVVLICCMTIQGSKNLKDERSVAGEFSNEQQEELLEWIKFNTKSDSVFAGPMPLSASILLSTGRSIVNHPHYEHADARNRTLKVYSIFSRKSATDVFSMLQDMQVDYIVLEENWCFDYGKPGCQLKDIWDVTYPEDIGRTPLCPNLFNRNAYPFTRVFKNDAYAVLKLKPKRR